MASTFDPSDPRWVLDPLPLYDELRETNPVHRTADGSWVFTRHADCLGILRDRRASSDSMHADPDVSPGVADDSRRAQARAAIRDGGEDTRPFLFRDPPDHTRLRGLVQRAFTPRTVAALTGFIEAETDRLLDDALAAQTFDVVDSLAWPLPVAVICELLGVPAEDHAEFKGASAALARGLDPEFLLPEDARVARDLALMHFAAYFQGLFEQRRRDPGDDLLSALVAAKDGEDRLSDGELLSTAILLLVAGHETTVNLLSGGTYFLATDQGAQLDWRLNRDLDRTAPDELLRCTSPVQLTGRTLTEPMAVGGAELEAGTFCMLLLGAANRDPAAFEEPSKVMLSRDPNPHLGFGFGLHHCLGAPLARLEARIALRRLLERTSGFEVADMSTVRYRPHLVLRGLERLDVTARAA